MPITRKRGGGHNTYQAHIKTTKKIQTVTEVQIVTGVQTVTEIQAVQIMKIIGSVEPNFKKRSLAADNTLESP